MAKPTGFITAHAIVSGRTLVKEEVDKAAEARKARIAFLNRMFISKKYTRRQLHELRHLTGRVEPPYVDTIIKAGAKSKTKKVVPETTPAVLSVLPPLNGSSQRA